MSKKRLSPRKIETKIYLKSHTPSIFSPSERRVLHVSEFSLDEIDLPKKSERKKIAWDRKYNVYMPTFKFWKMNNRLTHTTVYLQIKHILYYSEKRMRILKFGGGGPWDSEFCFSIAAGLLFFADSGNLDVFKCLHNA